MGAEPQIISPENSHDKGGRGNLVVEKAGRRPLSEVKRAYRLFRGTAGREAEPESGGQEMSDRGD